MVFIKRLAAVISIAVLAGCTALPQQPEDERQPVLSGGDASAEETFVPTPNPYLAQEKNVPADAEARFEQALQAMQAEKWDQALAGLQNLTHTYPELSGPYVNLGLVHWEQGDEEKAAAALREAIAVNPLNVDAYNQLAILRREQGRFEDAEALYLKALDVWPHSPDTHRNLGILYDLYMGHFQKALQHYQMSQKVASEPDRRVEGWIVDLKRRMAQTGGS